jgi:mono/diheme cytochrome c family protein
MSRTFHVTIIGIYALLGVVLALIILSDSHTVKAQEIVIREWSFELGHSAYTRYCATCHGPEGGGNLGPPLAGNYNLAHEDYVVARILRGGQGMPPFHARLAAEEVRSVINFIRTSWGNSLEPTEEARVAWRWWEGIHDGEELYDRICARCHGEAGGGFIGPPLAANQNLQSARYVVSKIQQGRGGMPAFEGLLTSEQIVSLASYIRTAWQNNFGPVSLEQTQQRQEEQRQTAGTQGQQTQGEPVGEQGQQGDQQSGQQTQQNQQQGQTQQNRQEEQQGNQQLVQQGQQVYQNNCAQCHGQNGRGGVGPALAGNQSLQNTQMVISQIHNGGGGMPAFGDQLSDQQIAAVASFIRSSWGNSFGTVSPEQVQGQGQGSQQQNQQQQNQQGQQAQTTQEISGLAVADGGHIFEQHCQVCHGNRGGGGIGPAFAGNPRLQATGYTVSRIVMGGGGMPAFNSRLSSAEIAAVASFIRMRWGNDFGTVGVLEAQQYHGGHIQAGQQSAQGQAAQEQQAQAQQTEDAQASGAPARLQVTSMPEQSRITIVGPDRFVYFLTLTTNETVAELRPGTYTVTATKAGYGPAYEQVHLQPGGSATVSLTLQRLEKAGPEGEGE